VETFDTQIAEPVAAAGGVQLMVVDTATNDYNQVLHDIKRLSEERRRELVLEAPILIEALLRQLLSLRPQPQVLYLQTAWFGAEPKWAAQMSILKHYGVPGLHVPLALQRQGTLLRECYLGDPVHPSSLGHQLIASAVLQQLESTLPPVMSHPHSFEKLLRGMVVDFTSATLPAGVEGVQGWQLGVERKMDNGSYVLLPPGGPQGVAGTRRVPRDGKAGFYAAEPGASFDLRARFNHDRLRVGHLRSWDKRVGVVEVLSRRDGTSGWVHVGALNGTWTRPASVYAHTLLRAPHANATLRFTLLPRAPARFVMYTIAII